MSFFFRIICQNQPGWTEIESFCGLRKFGWTNEFRGGLRRRARKHRLLGHQSRISL